MSADGYGWSQDEETFHGPHETREAAIQAAKDELGLDCPDIIRTAQFDRWRPYGLADHVMDYLAEQANEHVPGPWDDVCPTTVARADEELLERLLGSLMDGWLSHRPDVPWPLYEVSEIRTHETGNELPGVEYQGGDHAGADDRP